MDTVKPRSERVPYSWAQRSDLVVAAAPDLLAALKGLSRGGCFCGVSIGNPMYGGVHSPACIAAYAAIKKAEGLDA